MIGLQVTRVELEILHEALRFHHGEVAKELAIRIHSIKGDFDTEMKTVVDPFREKYPDCKAPDWTVRMGFQHDGDCGWCSY